MLRQMMSEYADHRAVTRWFTAKRRAVVFTVGLASGLAVLTASLIEIVRTLG